jgi:hypothetical protein
MRHHTVTEGEMEKDATIRSLSSETLHWSFPIEELVSRVVEGEDDIM